MNVVNGVRVNTGMAYLDNAVRARANLSIRGDALVDRVLFEGKRAVGVRLASGEEIHAGEVILSAGAYGSPAILLRSGVGPADEPEGAVDPLLPTCRWAAGSTIRSTTTPMPPGRSASARSRR